VKEFRGTMLSLPGIETLQGMTVDEARAMPLEARPKRASALIESQREALCSGALAVNGTTIW